MDALTAAKLCSVVVHHRKVATPPYPTAKRVMPVRLLQHTHVGQVSHLSTALIHIFMQAAAFSVDLPLEWILLVAVRWLYSWAGQHFQMQQHTSPPHMKQQYLKPLIRPCMTHLPLLSPAPVGWRHRKAGSSGHPNNSTILERGTKTFRSLFFFFLKRKIKSNTGNFCSFLIAEDTLSHCSGTTFCVQRVPAHCCVLDKKAWTHFCSC